MEPAKFDLEGYLERIGYDGPIEASPYVLADLHEAHLAAIVFENLDILLGKSIVLDLESLQGKLVKNRRGGYCFEQNTLFRAALETIGFTVTSLAARVRADGTGRTETVRDPDHLLEILGEHFGLSFPAGTRFQKPEF